MLRAAPELGSECTTGGPQRNASNLVIQHDVRPIKNGDHKKCIHEVKSICSPIIKNVVQSPRENVLSNGLRLRVMSRDARLLRRERIR